MKIRLARETRKLHSRQNGSGAILLVHAAALFAHACIQWGSKVSLSLEVERGLPLYCEPSVRFSSAVHNMSSIVTIDDLIRRIPGVRRELLYKKCSDQHLKNIAKELTQWRLTASWLGLKTIVDDLDKDVRFDEKDKRQRMLEGWQEEKGTKATYWALAEALLQVGRTDLAEKLLSFLKGNGICKMRYSARRLVEC